MHVSVHDTFVKFASTADDMYSLFVMIAYLFSIASACFSFTCSSSMWPIPTLSATLAKADCGSCSGGTFECFLRLTPFFPRIVLLPLKEERRAQDVAVS